MSTIAVVGAGPGLGLSIARRFASEGFDVALIARSRERVETLAQQLVTEGFTAAGFSADVTDRSALTDALDGAGKHFGGIDVLEYSPGPKVVPGQPLEMTTAGPLDVTPENLQPEIEYYLYGAVTAARAVLPRMRQNGTGTLLFTTGGGSINPVAQLANINAAAAALRNWALNLHQALDGTGVYAAHVAISAWIGTGEPESAPETIAETYWRLHTERNDAELHYQAL